MKRYIKFLMIALSAGAVLAACTREGDTDVAGGKEIRFSASVGQFEAKATATEFEEGDAIGLFAPSPVAVDNARLSFVNGVPTADTPLYWDAYQPADEAIPFYAYYPYKEGVQSTFNFSVSLDQSLGSAYEDADLMIASTMAKPSDDAVQLHFAHRMVRAVFNIENRVGGQVTEVILNGVSVDAQVDITIPYVGISDGAERYSVKAAPVVNPNGGKAWSVILPPQLCEGVSLTVKLDSGKEYTIDAGGSKLLEEGRSYNLKVIVDEALGGVYFSADISDWIDVWDVIGKSDDPGKLKVTWDIIQNNKSYKMVEQEDGLWYVLLPDFNSRASFQVVKRNNYYSDPKIPSEEFFGSVYPGNISLEVKAGEPLEIALCPDSVVNLHSDTFLPALECWLDPVARRLTVTAVDHKWNYLGTGKMVETLIASLFYLPRQEIDVDIDEDLNMPGTYRLRTPYKNWECPEGFRFFPGYDLIINTDAYGAAWFDDTFTGIYSDEMGYISFMSNMGEFREGDKYFSFWSMDYYTDVSSDRLYLGTPMYITLPGGQRPEDLNVAVDFLGYDNAVGADGAVGETVYAHFEIYAGMDVKNLAVGLYPGHLSSAEVSSVMPDVLQIGTYIEVVPQDWTPLAFPIRQTGTYTLVAVGVGASGKYNGNVARFAVLVDDEAPEASMSLDVTPGYFAESEVFAHVDFPNVNEVKALILEDAVWQREGIAEGDIFDYVMSNSASKNPTAISSDGIDFYLGNLSPETSYRILVAGTTAFGQSAWAEASITTGAVPSFSVFGTGHYSDNFMNIVGADGYYTEVQILKADTNPVRYRALDPYKNYWLNPNEGYDSYSGNQAAWIDFCIVEDKIIYLPYYTGYLEQGYGDVQYSCRNKFNGYFYANNAKLQEGVYNIAPAAYIVGTQYYYDLTSAFDGTIYLEMPGYTYNKPNNAPARRSALVSVREK